MDKAAIKKFAVSARRKLMEAVAQKAFELGITRDSINDTEIYQDGFMINQKFYKKYEIKQREKLIKEIESKGYDQVIDEAAYTWFNRFIALRFMEVNDYLPAGIRVFSSIEEGKTDPDALIEALMLVDDLGLDEAKVYELQDAGDEEDLFKYILVKQCNKLGEIMPMMFERIEDYTELLLPNNLLAESSVIHDMVTMMKEEDWTKEVEIIGWLYQYYISEKKDEVFAGLKKNKKITKENIPAATELFTPRWIVQYMVDNSLGRLWLESHPDPVVQQKLTYYLEAAEQPASVREHLETLKDLSLNPESITFLDPCMGSGHILVYAFEVLYDIYKSQGYREQDIPKLIIEKNLYGLDIDPRAAQLSYFSVLMKARQYHYRLFDEEIKTNIRWIEESNVLTEQDLEVFVGDSDVKQDAVRLFDTFQDAQLYGAILEMPKMDLDALKDRIRFFREADHGDLFSVDFVENSLDTVERLVEQAGILAASYDVAVTNPPYMGRKGMNAELANYVKKHYQDSSADLYAVFMEVASRVVKDNRFIGLINQHSWMFLSSFEKLREKMLNQNQIYSMAHLGARAFSEIGGEVVQTTSFVIRKNVIADYKATFVRLSNIKNAYEKAESFFMKDLHFNRTQNGFSNIPGSPIAYWASDRVRNIFRESTSMQEIADPKAGLATGDNSIFQRFWYEVIVLKIGFDYFSASSTVDLKHKWFPCESGGEFKKWFGNKNMVVDWYNDGEKIKNFRDEKGRQKSRPQNVHFYFKAGITWNKLSSSYFAVRYKEADSIFDDTSRSAFPKNISQTKYILGLLTSKLSTHFMSFLNPTLSFTNSDIKRIPIVNQNDDNLTKHIHFLIDLSISISKSDWDSFETSWDFQTHPFKAFQHGATKLEDVYANWEREAHERFQQLKANEEELNRIFIDLYGLQDELKPEVQDVEVTVSQADRVRDVKSFLSYAVGLMLGRYSLDQGGLAFAGGEFNLEAYQTFKPDQDNVIPIVDDVYFEDDIVTRFAAILKTIFDKDTLEDNLDFIADILKKRTNETSRQRIRRYFLKEFFKDHTRIYKKRPIYWLFDSGKEDGFKALVYLHRYEPGLVSTVRTQYLHAQERKYVEEIDRLDNTLEVDISQQEKTRAKKAKEKLRKQLQECRQYDQVIAYAANQKIDLDLDDGVKVNYAKFQNIEVPQGEGRAPLKADVLAKI